MRGELQFLEQIDLYLSGQMGADEKAAFENLLSSDSDANEIFEMQKSIIQANKRAALIQEIQTIAGGIAGPSWIATNAKWILSVLVVGTLSVGAVFMIDNSNDELVKGGHLPLGDTTKQDELMMSEQQNSKAYTAKIELPEGIRPKKDKPSDKSGTSAYINSMTFFPNIQRFNFVSYVEDEFSDEKNEEVVNESRRIDSVSEIYAREYNRIAHFPDGNLAMKIFVNKHLRYPEEAAMKNIDANVQADFWVLEDGRVSEPMIKCFQLAESQGDFSKPYSGLKMLLNKSLAREFEYETLRLIALMPDWISATNSRGETVDVNVRLYFDFNARGELVVYQLQEAIYKKERGKGWKFEG